MTEKKNCLIIGASHAGAQLCASLRQGGFQGSIGMIGAERELPYHRPPLSKAYLSGEKAFEDILLRPESTYRNLDVSLMLGRQVTALDVAEKTVTLDKAQSCEYDVLALTTGARARRLNIPGADLPNVFYLRTCADVQAIRSEISAGKQAVIIGGGYIGLEVAASLRKLQMQVTVLEAMERVLQRVTAPELSRFYRRVHQEEGVQVFENVAVSHLICQGERLEVRTSAGESFCADMVIIGVGVEPNAELAQAAGLTVSNGIEVDEFCQTSQADIYAAGDVCWHYNRLYDRHIRLESVPNATEQAKVIAAHINGQPYAYDSLPWFWSDQYDLKLQIAGLSEGYDDVRIRGDIETGRQFSVFYFKGSDLLAVDAVNSPREFMLTRRVLSRRQSFDKMKIEDMSEDLQQAII